MSQGERTTEGMVIEWAPFRLAESASEDALLRAAEALQRDFLERQPGYLRRELLRAADGRWFDFIVWKDEPSAAAAMQDAPSHAPCQAYFALMRGSADGIELGADLLHLQRVRAWG